jgi:CBS domain-containing protein
MEVRDVMTTTVRTIWPTASLKEAALYLREYRVSGLPVVDEHGRVVGVVSESDVVRADAAPPPEHAPHAVADVMSAPAIVTRPDAPLAEAARRMVTHDVTRLPVLSEGRLVGVISRSDVVAALAAPDDELRTAALAVVARLPVERASVAVEVSGGRVRLRGEVPLRRQAEWIAREVSLLPGVKAVLPELTWTVDDAAGS